MDSEEQEDELLALKSIFDPDIFNSDNDSGQIKIIPTLNSSSIELVICNSSSNKESECQSNTRETLNNSHHVENLPPITLNFTYPSNYPSQRPPELTLSCIWLTRRQLNHLCLKLDQIWEEDKGNVILFSWSQFLQDEALSYLGIENVLYIGSTTNNSELKNVRDLPSECMTAHTSAIQSSNNKVRAIQEVQNNSQVLPMLLVYDQQIREEKFKKSIYLCNICFESKSGTNCLQFMGCNHVYCKNCLCSYFKVHIEEGSVTELRCPEVNCKTLPLPKMIQELVDSTLYARYEKLLLQTTLDKMPDVTYCPLTHCQAPVILEAESRIAQCPCCSYAFCPLCRLSYHGVSNCRISSSEFKKLCEEYMVATPERKLLMEKKYGRKTFTTAIENSLTSEWMNSNAKSCPGCKAHIEKIDGCNKMSCYKCGAYFCWLCLGVLHDANPYRHFSDPKSKCFNLLFEGMANDGFDDFDDEFDDNVLIFR